MEWIGNLDSTLHQECMQLGIGRAAAIIITIRPWFRLTGGGRPM